MHDSYFGSEIEVCRELDRRQSDKRFYAVLLNRKRGKDVIILECLAGGSEAMNQQRGGRSS